jgi:molybdate-binding protein/predicted nucleic acid-binding protein
VTTIMTTSNPVKLLLDTSYCLFLIRSRVHAVQAAFEHYRPGEIAVSSLTVAVLQSHARRSLGPARNQRALEQFLLPLVVVDFDGGAALTLGRIGGDSSFGDARRAHALLLAAQAIHLNATLITAQPELYAAINGLTLRVGLDAEVNNIHAVAPVVAAAGERVIRISGSHDLSLTLLADWLHAEHPDIHIEAAYTGSLRGLEALLQRTAHAAGSHLFDAATGEFNVGLVRRLFAPHAMRAVIVGFVERTQGILTAHGNPKQIGGVSDLVREDVIFVNRQPGSGTRVLLDYQLYRLGIDPQAIHGYAREEATHLAVATAVAQGAADCGMGIQAAAQALGLHFIPVMQERFDLVVPLDVFESALWAPLQTLLQRRDVAFCARVAALGGYSTTPMGRIVAEV